MTGREQRGIRPIRYPIATWILLYALIIAGGIGIGFAFGWSPLTTYSWWATGVLIGTIGLGILAWWWTYRHSAPPDDRPSGSQATDMSQTGRLPGSTYERYLPMLLYEVLHELKQPLTIMDGYIQLLQKRETDAQTRSDLAAVHRQIRRMMAYIERFRQPVHLATHPEWTDVMEIVRGVLQIFTPVARRHHVRLDLELYSIPPVCIRAQEWEQLLWNLLENGLKALQAVPPEQRVLTLRIHHFTPVWDVTERSEDARAPLCGLTLVVRDTGPGIPPDEQAAIFTPFFSRRPGTRHMGLGLAICRYIVERNGGRIEVRSAPGRGTEFRVWWPCARPHTDYNDRQ